MKSKHDISDQSSIHRTPPHKINLIKQRDHSSSTYAKFPKTLNFLPPDTHMYLSVLGDKKS